MIYSLTNLNNVTWGTRETFNGQSDAVVQDHSAPQKTNLIFNWWRKKQNPGQVPEQEDGNVIFGCGNLCKFMFCMHQKEESEKTQVLCQGIEELKQKVDQIDRRLRMEQEPQYMADYRAMTTLERNQRMNFPRNQAPMAMLPVNPLHPAWLDDRSLKLAESDYLTGNEQIFWKDLITRYDPIFLLIKELDEWFFQFYCPGGGVKWSHNAPRNFKTSLCSKHFFINHSFDFSRQYTLIFAIS